MRLANLISFVPHGSRCFFGIAGGGQVELRDVLQLVADMSVRRKEIGNLPIVVSGARSMPR